MGGDGAEGLVEFGGVLLVVEFGGGGQDEGLMDLEGGGVMDDSMV